VDFCTPSFLHAEQAVAALDAGKHVLCETPACHSIEEARRIRWAVEQHPDLVAATGHVARCWPTFEQAHRLVTAGEIGRLFMLEAHYAHKPDPDEYPSARTWGRDITKRVRLGVAHHAIDLLRWLAGDVHEVMGDRAPQASVAVLRFHSGALGHIFTSNAVVQPYDLSVAAYGDRGTIVTRWEEQELRGLVHRSAQWAPADLERTPLHGRGSPEWAREMGRFVDAILGHGAPACPMTDGVAAVETGLAIQQAMDIGTRVRVVS
jgi:myo-inositol 2-dehydrogenase/D-chiro-inositol 1-dehydrogenase